MPFTIHPEHLRALAKGIAPHLGHQIRGHVRAAVNELVESVSPAPTRIRYSREFSPIHHDPRPRRKEQTMSIIRHQYRRDFDAVATVIEDQDERIAELQAMIDRQTRGDIRHQYRAAIEELQYRGYDVDPDEEVAALPADPEKAERFGRRRVEAIRLHYQRGDVRPAAHALPRPGSIRSEADLARVRAYCTQRHCSFDDGKRALGFSV